nr:histidinol dehydrogenase [Actinomycetota bacterium]
MLRRVDFRGKRLTKGQYQRELPRASLDIASAMIAIEPILQRVRNGNESDLIALAQEFDGVAPASIKVDPHVINQALIDLDPEIRKALEVSAARIRTVHLSQVRSESSVTVVDGGVVREKWIPVDRVGLY